MTGKSKEEIFARIREVLVESFDLKPDDICLQSHLVDDLDLDSIDAIDLAVGLEEELGLKVEEDELREIRLVGDIVDLVHAKLLAG